MGRQSVNFNRAGPYFQWMMSTMMIATMKMMAHGGCSFFKP
jgi:hypothetical protein